MKTIFKKFSPHQMALLICYVLVYLLICLLHATLICYKDKCSTGCQKLFIESCRCFAFFCIYYQEIRYDFPWLQKQIKRKTSGESLSFMSHDYLYIDSYIQTIYLLWDIMYQLRIGPLSPSCNIN